MTTTKTLASRIAEASIAVGALATDKRNAQQGYDYISADKVLERCGDALAHAGVVLIPAIIAEDMTPVDVTTGRGPGVRYDADITFAMTLTDGETTLEFPWRGRGSDYSVPDKALYKAVTSGHKYFLLKLLNVGVGNEDGEHEVAEPAQRTQPTRQEKTPAKPAAPTTPPPAAADVDFGMIANGDSANPFEDGDGEPNMVEVTLSELKGQPLSVWYEWAVGVDGCENVHEAQASWDKIVREQFGGKLSAKTGPLAARAYVTHQLEKAAAKAA